MAHIHFSLAISTLLLSLVVVSSASRYGNGYAPKPEPEKPKAIVYVPKPELEKSKTNGYRYAPKPELEKSKTNGYGYAPKPELEKPKTNGYGYAQRPELQKPKTSGYVPKQEFEKPKTNGYGYAPKQELEKPRTQGKLLPFITAVQGLIYGALARITCLAVDKNGYESAPFSVLSHPTDAKGYFYATVSPYELEDAWKLKECKAFLEKSPLESCKVPTDVNKGIGGAPLFSYHLLEDKNIKLYSVGPFFYSPDPKPVPKGY